jgi:hypothetical protein
MGIKDTAGINQIFRRLEKVFYGKSIFHLNTGVGFGDPLLNPYNSPLQGLVIPGNWNRFPESSAQKGSCYKKEFRI